jgi:hypothetical protein
VQMKAAMQGITTSPISQADARAKIAEAIDMGDHSLPPIETDSWPQCRPMIDWIVRHLPVGGVGYEREEWTTDQRVELMQRFLASPFAAVAGLDADAVRLIAEPFVMFACDYGPGDPLRWSTVSVEIVLTSWYPNKVLGASERVPDVLAAFVRFAHAERAIPADRTRDTLAGVERWRRAYDKARTEPKSGLSAHLSSFLDAYDGDDFIDN